MERLRSTKERDGQNYSIHLVRIFSSYFPLNSIALVLVASQNFEYKMSNILDKPTESLFGYISVLVSRLLHDISFTVLTQRV